jgi:hypothetical protein
MPDNIFENKLNEQMGDFKFSPSDAVWLKLEKELTKRKKRRTGFIWFFAGLLLVSAGLIIVTRNDGKMHVSDTVTNNTNSILERDQKAVVENNEKPKQNDSDATGPGAKAQLPAFDSTSNVKAFTKKRNLSASGPTLLSLSGRNAVSTNIGKAGNKAPAASQEYAAAPPVEKAEYDPLVEIIPDMAMVDPVRSQNQLHIPVQINGKTNIASPVAVGNPVSADSVSQTDASKKTTTQKRPVTFGLRMEAGRSSVPEKLFSTQKSADLNSVPNTGSGPVVFYPYEQNPLFGWSLGGWIKKPLSPKITLESGLIYHQYRTATPVGNQGQGSLSTGSGSNSMTYDQYFRQGDSMTYTNRYHLLSVPAAFSFLLNKGKSLPVSWYAGIEPGWLIGSNALIKDTSGMLYSDNGLFNRFQVGLETGFSFRLWNKSRRPVELGPVFRYMISPVFKNGTNYAGHLSFIGLRADWALFNLKQKQR